MPIYGLRDWSQHPYMDFVIGIREVSSFSENFGLCIKCVVFSWLLFSLMADESAPASPDLTAKSTDIPALTADEVLEESDAKENHGTSTSAPPVDSHHDPKTPEKKSKTAPKIPSAPKKRKKTVRKGLVSGALLFFNYFIILKWCNAWFTDSSPTGPSSTFHYDIQYLIVGADNMDKVFPHLAASTAPPAFASAPIPRSPAYHAPARPVSTVPVVKEPTRSINQGDGFFCQKCGYRMKKHPVYTDNAGELHYECPEN